jgi:hypothetical protein
MNISPSDNQRVGLSAPGAGRPAAGNNNEEEDGEETGGNKTFNGGGEDAGGLLPRRQQINVSQHDNVPSHNVDNEEDDDDEDDDDEEEEQQPNYDHLPPLKRPRKKVYKSTLRKRNREKKRRDHFNDGLEQLAGESIRTRIEHDRVVL